MSYAIGNIVLGTYAPWEKDVRNKLVELLGEDYQEETPWEGAYHGSSLFSVAWVGVVLTEFDECDNFSLSMLQNLSTPEHEAKAKALYEQLPEAARAILPPFGIYVVWSSS